MSVTYDAKTDSLIYDRNLKPGPGKPIYGITFAKYIINDPEFMKLTQEISNELLNVPQNICTNKTSKYNSSLYMIDCSVCGISFNPDISNIGIFQEVVNMPVELFFIT